MSPLCRSLGSDLRRAGKVAIVLSACLVLALLLLVFGVLTSQTVPSSREGGTIPCVYDDQVSEEESAEGNSLDGGSEINPDAESYSELGGGSKAIVNEPKSEVEGGELVKGDEGAPSAISEIDDGRSAAADDSSIDGGAGAVDQENGEVEGTSFVDGAGEPEEWGD